MLRKFFSIKDLCLRVLETHLQTGNCAKGCKLNRVMPQELKGNYKLFKKSEGWKAQRTFSFFYTSLGAVLTQHKGNFAELTLHRIGLLLLEKKRWLKSWHNRREDPLNLAVVVAPPVWALLVDALRVEDFLFKTQSPRQGRLYWWRVSYVKMSNSSNKKFKPNQNTTWSTSRHYLYTRIGCKVKDDYILLTSSNKLHWRLSSSAVDAFDLEKPDPQIVFKWNLFERVKVMKWLDIWNIPNPSVLPIFTLSVFLETVFKPQ